MDTIWNHPFLFALTLFVVSGVVRDVIEMRRLK